MSEEERFKRTIRSIREREDLPAEADTLSFNAPWEARLFSLIVTLYDRGLFEWDEFQSRLGAHPQDLAKTQTETPDSTDFDRWISAFERLLVDKGIWELDEIAERTHEFSSGIRDASEFVTSEGKRDHTRDHHHQ